MISALSEIKQLGCSFVVGGRKQGAEFVTLEDILGPLKLPKAITEMFVGLPPETFRVDLSSTEIRAQIEAEKQAEKKHTPQKFSK